MDGEGTNLTIHLTLLKAAGVDPVVGIQGDDGLPLWLPFAMLAAGAVIVLYVATSLRRSVRHTPTGRIDPLAPLTNIRMAFQAWRRRSSPNRHGSAIPSHESDVQWVSHPVIHPPHPPHSPNPVHGPASLSPANAARTLAELQRLHRDLIELAQRQAVEADIRAARLEELIAKADERLDRLNRAVRIPQPSAPRTSPASTMPDAPKEAQPEIRVLAISPASNSLVTAGTQSRAATTDSPLPSAPERARPAPDALQREVCRLADEGMTPIDIAKRLGQHTGKVELILALRR
ncbi:MAG: hypothetical protein KF768_02760 [Phycisphaeraceae bacterium]|nr:hypothetical protein [Phycisphaeraceae bacterium]